MTQDLEPPALVLLDEVGAGTDPTEGGALGVAIVDGFRRRGAMVVATTHHGLMKAYAQSTAGVALRLVRLRPRDLRADLSAAARTRRAAAWRWRWPSGWGCPRHGRRTRARRLDQKEAQAEALLKTLEQRAGGAAATSSAHARAAQADLQATARAARERSGELARAQADEIEAFARELRRRGEEAARKAADAIREAVRSRGDGRQRGHGGRGRQGARSEAIGAIREAHDEALRDRARRRPPCRRKPRRRPVASACASRVRSLGVIGRGGRACTASGEVELAVGGKRLRVPRGRAGRAGCQRARSGARESRRPAREQRAAVPRRDQPRRA